MKTENEKRYLVAGLLPIANCQRPTTSDRVLELPIKAATDGQSAYCLPSSISQTRVSASRSGGVIVKNSNPCRSPVRYRTTARNFNG